ncbi:hypothetical protein F5Y13DRAFT_201028 [Hypoxylon sp. FL1857]|nr:hypothetical protein F5Y13DRAFT_201028 [Hypoxylon sp. FL1857]
MATFGFVRGIHYGDVFIYNTTKRDRTLKHDALERHNQVKAAWEHSGTCDWLLQDRNYQSWENVKEGNSFLWLHGRLGCGKSTLMSYIIENIYRTQFPTETPDALHLLYFYVSYGDDDQKGLLYQNMLTTFWEQAVETRSLRNHTRPEFIENELLEVLVSSGRHIYIVIDAIDQLQLVSQYKLVSWLNNVAQKLKYKKSSHHLSVAISSRDCNGIDRLRAHQLFTIEVTAESNENDINKYLQKNLRSMLFQERPELRDQVLEKLNKDADGMFVWVSLMTSNICRMELEQQVKNALANLVPTRCIQDMYRTYAEGFETSEGIRRQIALRTMALLAADSTGSMSKEVILVALSLKDDGKVDDTLYQELARDPSVIIRFCSHLVRINENLGVIQFSHRTVLEFFRAYQEDKYNYRITELCLWHLSSPDFAGGPSSDATWYSPGSLNPILQKHPFLPYASSRWATGIKKIFNTGSPMSPQSMQCGILKLLQRLLHRNETAEEEGENLQLAFQIYLLSLQKTMSGGVYHEHIISYFGLVEECGSIRCSFDWDKEDDDGLRPIHWALRNNIDLDNVALTVKKLLEFDVDINAKDNEGRTPLYYAAYYGNLEATKLLSDKKVKLDCTNRNKETALIAACRKHHEKTVLYLVKAGADVRIQSSFGTALQAISLIGCCTCAEEILGRYGKSKIIEPDGPFGTSLHAAAFHGRSELVKLLCSKRINIHATHRTYGSPLTAAAAGLSPGMDPAPFLDIIQELVKHGVNVDDRSGVVGPALRAAAYHGNPELVSLLLEKGAKVQKAMGPMGTAYEAADGRGHEAIMDMLVESDPKAQDHQLIQRKIFKATVRTSSLDSISSLISQFEQLFEKEIGRGDTPCLRRLAKRGENSFLDVVELTTKPPNNSDTPSRRQETYGMSRDVMSNFCFADQDGYTLSRTESVSETLPRPCRATSALVQGDLDEHISQVLDRMAQAAVKILGYAIASENREEKRREGRDIDKHRSVIRLIANTWVGALNKLVSYPDFGESMLEMVVQRRANELKRQLTNSSMSLEERSQKAKALALVGIELLLVAVERGQRFEHLSFVISRLWIKAVNDAEEFGEQGEVAIRKFIDVLVERFSNAVMIQDQANAQICAQAGIELVRAAALNPNTKLLDKCCEELVIQWGHIVDSNMEFMVEVLINQRRKEYQECPIGKKYDKALGLALASMGALRVAIKHRNHTAIDTLQHFMKSSVLSEKVDKRKLGTILDYLINLFATAEEEQPDCLSALGVNVLDCLGAVLGVNYQVLKKVAKYRIKLADRVVEPREREKQLVQISRTILFFLELALDSEERNHNVFVVLKEIALGSLARTFPDFMSKNGLARYGRAIRYLKSGDLGHV